MTKAERSIDVKALLKPLLQENRSWDLLTLDEALIALEDGFPAQPSPTIIARILHTCRKQKNLSCSMRLHAYMHNRGMEAHPLLGNYLVSLLVEVGSVEMAQDVYNLLSYRQPSSCNSLIAGYLKGGMLGCAFALYEEMRENSCQLSEVNYVALLKACAKLKDLERGQYLHADVSGAGLLQKGPFIGSILVDMYSKCGSISRAREVFDSLPVQGVVTWTAMISGYVIHECYEEALECFEQMLLADFTPDGVTFTCSLKACSNLGATENGQEIHAEIVRRGLLGDDLLIGSSLVDMYMNCGFIAQAEEVFKSLVGPDVVLWTTLISGYTRYGHGEKALEYFEKMQLVGVPPNGVTYACSLKACASVRAIQKGELIHEEVRREGVRVADPLIGNALVDMYAKLGLLVKAQIVFDELAARDIVSWNTLIAGYVKHGHDREALKFFKLMQCDGFLANAVTLVCCAKACGSLGAVVEGQGIHAEVIRGGFLAEDYVGNMLVDMYMRCSSFTKAQQVFDELPNRGVVSWNSLISGYIKHGYWEEAFHYLGRMEEEDIPKDVVTYVCALKACGGTGALDKGEQIFAEITQSRSLNQEPAIGNALVDMYAKCGFLVKAQEVFDKLLNRDVVSWSCLVAGYGQRGEPESVFDIVDKMDREGVKPNAVTFTSVLNTCSRAGLVEIGEAWLRAMNTEYGMLPSLEHHSCMVDLLSRVGQVDKAAAMITHMPFHPDVVLWHTIMGACQGGMGVELGRWVFEHAVRLDEKIPATYVLLSNIYIDNEKLDRWDIAME